MRRRAAMPVAFAAGRPRAEEVAITYAGHSTYYIDTPGGVRIATDFNGAYRTGRLPDVVTMNRAHGTHYTLFPDPRIPVRAAWLGRQRRAGQSRNASATSSSAT